MSHSLIITLLIAFPSASLISGIIYISNLKRFVDTTPRIETNQDLELFKNVVRHQMYAALLQIVLLGTPIIIFTYGTISGILEFGDVLYVVIPNLIVIIVSRILRKTEKKAQSISASTPQLVSAVSSIVYSWENKALPDW
ncbi:MAG: hypothetical protein K8S62_05685 [Candidatus Sabulitectum sp.]|nr:hypothetical protein [Candidatus Sabulitectum sp.]